MGGFDALESARPGSDLVVQGQGRFLAQAEVIGLDAVQLREQTGGGQVALADHLSRWASRFEPGFEGLALDEAHHHGRGPLRWVARGGVHNLGHRNASVPRQRLQQSGLPKHVPVAHRCQPGRRDLDDYLRARAVLLDPAQQGQPRVPTPGSRREQA